MRRKHYVILIVIFWTTALVHGQSDMSLPATPTATVAPDTNEVVQLERGVLEVESAFVRALPSREADPVSSVFERDSLEILGRNIDGLWFEVKRPNRGFALGWISAALLDIDFAPETLPLTDMMTGLLGATPIPEEHLAVYLTAEANLRTDPFLNADLVSVVPLGAILPATGRDGTGGWVYVNYRGNEGWINRTVFRTSADLLEALPDITFVEENVAQLDSFIIPPEIQLGQLEAFRGYVIASRDVATQLVPFWENVLAGEVMPCEPPAFVQEYLITNANVRELPELNRYVPRYNEGVILLNEAISPLYTCGVLQSEVVTEARNDAINANIIMNVTVDQLASLETLIRENNNLEPVPTTASP